MGALGTHGIENRPIKKNSTPDVDDSPSPSLPDERDNTVEDEPFGDTVPCEDIDAFDTQIMDFENETQPMDLCEDTQILYLAGETQVMDDFELDELMDTQLLSVSDDETNCESDEQCAERPQLVHDSKEFVGRNGDQTGAVEESETDTSHQDDREARTDTLTSDDAVQNSGSLRKGFAAVRTASLRAAGLAAQKKFLENARRSCSTEFSSRSSNLQCSNDNDGVFDVEAVDLEHGTETDDEKGLFKSKVARSLAKELFMEADCADELECNNSHSGEMTGLSKLPACETEVAGLSYVDSQEPGELSQANALEFVDRFLKINVFEPDLDVTNRNATGEMVSPGRIAKGPQSLAQQANRRSSLGVASAFDWDDTHEDEGGGEFFTKKKEALFGTSCGARKFCMKPRNSRHHGPKGSQSVGKLKNEKEQRKTHAKVMGLVHSDSKLVRSRKVGELEETNEKGDSYPDRQLGLLSCNAELLASATNAEPTSMLDVGIDTQMAAEAMEALSFGSALVTNNGSIGDEGNKDVSRKKTAKNTLLKQSSIEKGPRLSRSGGSKSNRTNGVTKKSGEETKSSVAFRTRSQYTVGEFNIDLGKPKVKRRRLQVKNISAVNERGSSDRLASVGGKEIVCALEGRLNNNGSLPLERHNSHDKASVSTPAAQKTGQLSVNGVNDESDDFGRQRQCLDVVQSGIDKTNCATRSDVDSDNLNAREKTSNIITVKDNAKVNRSSCRGKSLQLASNQVNESGGKQSSVKAFGGLEFIPHSITRRTRSKRSARCAEFPQDVCQLSSGKHQPCSPPAKGERAHIEGEESPVQVQISSSPTDITPIGLKTPESAVSPLCVGDGYPTTPFCKGKRSLKREFYSLTASEPKYISPSKDLRQRRDFSNVRVLFSQHLDDDIIKKQKKVLSRLGVPVASSISEATHFVADMFVRTRNMLEAIACGKPVVTHLWLESCGQSNCFIDEKNHILRDAKKEKELGFSMPNSLARASHCPLLEGRRVLITPKVKPSKQIVSGLVKAVHGQATERLCRTLSNNDRLPDDLLVLSCDEDLQECLPLLEKGIAVYSSELLLNGIITQRLDYERYRIFVDQVKRTRSTLWVKKNGDQFLPVTITK